MFGLDARYIRERPSGIGAYVEALVERLPLMAPSVHFLLWADRRANRPLSTAPNVREKTVGTGPNSPLTILWPRWYASFDNLDLFHSPHNILPRSISCPSVVTVHDVMALEAPSLHRPGYQRLNALYYPRAVSRALRYASRVIVPSAATADRVAALVPEAKPRLHVIPMAPHPSFRPPEDILAARRRAAALIGADAPHMVVVGQNSVNKSHETALLAFAAAAPPPTRLVLLQRTGNPKALQRLARRLGVIDRVVWLSGLSREQVVLLVQTATALLQPSLYEGFGLPVVEAMASGCPVIASDIPALREVTGGAALLIPPMDIAACADAVRMLLASPERRRALAEQGLAQSRAFSWDRTARDTLAVYDEVVHGPARPVARAIFA